MGSMGEKDSSSVGKLAFPKGFSGKTVLISLAGSFPSTVVEGTWVYKKDAYYKKADNGRTLITPKMFFQEKGFIYEYVVLDDGKEIYLYYWVRPVSL